MKKHFLNLALLFVALLTVASCGKKYSYETVEGDPLNARIYTLDNGLKVYLSVNKETPRIQAYIPVRTGGKNDPAETTGLSHYLEHLMFKGTTHFGTQNYEAEKPLLDQITELYEVYRTKTDPEERKAINFDHPDAFDWKLLANQIEDLPNKCDVEVRYNPAVPAGDYKFNAPTTCGATATVFLYINDPMGLNDLYARPREEKYIFNGHLYIRVGDRLYDAAGRQQ